MVSLSDNERTRQITYTLTRSQIPLDPFHLGRFARIDGATEGKIIVSGTRLAMPSFMSFDASKADRTLLQGKIP